MTGYQYKGKLKGEADPWQQPVKPGPKPGYRGIAPAAELPNDPRVKRDRPPVRPPFGNSLRRFECGTPAGVSWHQRRGEPACEACREARSAERRAASGLECGTLRAYRWHVRSHTVPCPPCQAAYDQYKAEACGTMRGVKLHHKSYEPPCEPCKAARRAHKRAYKRGKAKA